MNKWEWETCDCKDPTNECGCECKHSRLIMGQQIHWLGKHWRLPCAFDHAVTLIRKGDRCDRMVEMVKKEWI